jgi:hypothetical protein
MSDWSRSAATPTRMPTDGDVVREAMGRIITIAVSNFADRFKRCPIKDCRRERMCTAPDFLCRAAPPLKNPDIEAQYPELAARLRRELVDILVERELGHEPDDAEDIETD